MNSIASFSIVDHLDWVSPNLCDMKSIGFSVLVSSHSCVKQAPIDLSDASVYR